MATAPPSAARPPSPTRTGQLDRRVLLASAALLAIAIIGGVVLVAATADPGPRRDPAGQAEEGEVPRPEIIARPNSGTAPQDPGDRGGWEQLALLGLLLAAMAGIGLVVFRGGRRARAGRRAWAAAAATGRDGAAERLGPTASPAVGTGPRGAAGEPEG